MRGIVNYNKTNNLNRWEILFFNKDKIFFCPINKDQLSILEQQDNGTEIEFKIDTTTKTAKLFPLEPTNEFYYYNILKGIIAFQQNEFVILYSSKGLHDSMHIDYFQNEFTNFDKISLKQFLFLFHCLNLKKINLLNVTTYNDLNYNRPKLNVYAEKYQVKTIIDPTSFFTSMFM